MSFKSAIDWWYWLVIGFVVITIVLSGLPVLNAGSIFGILYFVLVASIGVGLPIWLAFSTVYQITSDTLHIRSGPFSWTIPLAAITSVERSHSLVSSPALSLDRLEICYGISRTILVSPKDKVSFIEALNVRPNR